MKRVSKRNPCTICGRADWCGISDDGSFAICMRVESGRPSQNGGYVHILKLREHQRRPRRISLTMLRSASSVVADLSDRCREWQEIADSGGWLENLSENIGVSLAALRRFDVGFNAPEHCWTWPLRDAAGRIIGVNRRFPDSTKRVMFGTHAGLYIPDDIQIGAGISGVLLVVEGGSDACAGFDMGFPTVGRFSCTGQTDMLADLVRTMRPSVTVIVSDSDGPGRAGADRLARSLRPLVRCLKLIEPPAGYKDLRAWRVAGATDGDLIRLINETAPRPLRMEVVTHGR
jgi:hypothetical protein